MHFLSKLRRPSPAMAVAVVALFVALSGGAYAAVKITTSDIADSAVTHAKLAKDSVWRSNLGRGVVGASNLSKSLAQEIGKSPNPSAGSTGPSGTTGSQGPKGDTGPQGAKGDKGATGATGPAGQSAVTSATATTQLDNRTDSGNNGDWATDTVSRTMTVTRDHQVSIDNCGGTPTSGPQQCWFYTASLSDQGSFETLSGAKSPNTGAAINGTVDGSIVGSGKFEFYSDDPSPSAANVPAEASGNTTSSSDWPTLFLTHATVYKPTANGPEIGWSYTYQAPTTCEQWVDAYNNGDGGQAKDGDIAGVNAC